MHSLTKKGRPAAIYRATNGDQIAGLMRLNDGRWRASGPDKYTFSETDERLAIQHFRHWQSSRADKTGSVEVFAVDEQAPALEVALDRRRRAGNVRITIDKKLTTVVTDSTLRPDQWNWLREQIIRRPKWVAEQVAIEQIGYLADLPAPSPSPTLEEFGTLYFTYAKLSSDWRSKTKLFWSEFVAAVAVAKLREVTQDHILAYGDSVQDAGESPTYVRQRFGAIKTILNFPPKRGKWATDSARAVALCKCLVPPRKAAVDPNPIGQLDFVKLLKVSDDSMAAMLLLALNCCMYGGEVAALQWCDLDLEKGTLQTRRSKTGVVRIGVLWERTITALKKLPAGSGAIFISKTMQHNYQTVYKAFKAIRPIELASVQFSHIRDGAYTAAVEAGVDLNLCRLLAGHATGISDHYVKRRPKMVEEACRAIEAAYFG